MFIYSSFLLVILKLSVRIMCIGHRSKVLCQYWWFFIPKTFILVTQNFIFSRRNFKVARNLLNQVLSPHRRIFPTFINFLHAFSMSFNPCESSSVEILPFSPEISLTLTSLLISQSFKMVFKTDSRKFLDFHIIIFRLWSSKESSLSIWTIWEKVPLRDSRNWLPLR